MHAPTPAEESARHYRESLARALGPAVLEALANPDVDEIYVNPSGRLHLDTRSEGRLATSTLLLPEQVLRFLNLVASRIPAVLNSSRPALQAELPLELFRNARIQGFVPPLAATPVFNQLANAIVAEATGTAPPPKPEKPKNPAAVALGKLGASTEVKARGSQAKC